jgi:methylmalonyl-CoA/ethylmalonyl-CoA epimerase
LPGAKENAVSEGTKDDALFRGVRHIGIAVRDTEAAIGLFSALFEAKHVETMVSEEHGLKLTFLQVAGVNVELLEPVREDVTVAKFIKTKGEGFHHIAFEVTDIEQVLENLKKAGVKLIDETPRRGPRQPHAFIHPSSTRRMIELCQPVAKPAPTRPGAFVPIPLEQLPPPSSSSRRSAFCPNRTWTSW